MEEKFWFIPQRGLWGEGMWKHNGPGDKAHNKCLDTTTERPAKRSNSKPEEFPYKFALTFRFIKSPSIQAPPCHTHPIPPINHFGTYNTRCSFSLMTSFSESCPCLSKKWSRSQSAIEICLFALFVAVNLETALLKRQQQQQVSKRDRSCSRGIFKWVDAREEKNIGLHFNLFLGQWRRSSWQRNKRCQSPESSLHFGGKA